jgi:hypothetical protein
MTEVMEEEVGEISSFNGLIEIISGRLASKAALSLK